MEGKNTKLQKLLLKYFSLCKHPLVNELKIIYQKLGIDIFEFRRGDTPRPKLLVRSAIELSPGDF